MPLLRRVSRSTTREDLSGDEADAPDPSSIARSVLVTAAEVAHLVTLGPPFDDLVHTALVPSNKHAVREGGGIAPIVGLLSDDAATSLTSCGKTEVVSALWSLAAHTPANQDEIRRVGGVHRALG